ncbi:hypothetical protein IL306_012368 [Fusarium sp. DS 682]|nr:hypothetical protein IL306_012368 [Fusarium sp. DS 682]
MSDGVKGHEVCVKKTQALDRDRASGRLSIFSILPASHTIRRLVTAGLRAPAPSFFWQSDIPPPQEAPAELDAVQSFPGFNGLETLKVSAPAPSQGYIKTLRTNSASLPPFATCYPPPPPLIAAATRTLAGHQAAYDTNNSKTSSFPFSYQISRNAVSLARHLRPLAALGAISQQ